MSTLQQSLRALQAFDTDVETERQHIRSLQAELADERSLQEARAAYDRASATLKAAQTAVKDGEQKLERLARAIATFQTRLYDGSIHNAREAVSMEDELRHHQAERAATEDAVLAAMEQVETAQAQAAQAERTLQQVERERSERVPAIKAEGRAATARLRTLQEQRAALAAAAPPAILSRYERLRAATRPAVVGIVGGNCGGCGVAIPTAQGQKVNSGELVQCLNCNRILVE